MQNQHVRGNIIKPFRFGNNGFILHTFLPHGINYSKSITDHAKSM